MEEGESLVKLISGLGETSTFHGIPKIVTSRQRVVKVLWCLLLLGSVVLCSIQFYDLCKEYYRYPIKTTVQMKFTPLAFPALTFCNMNPIKQQSVRNYEHLLDLGHVQLLSEYAIAQNNTRDEFNAWKNRYLTGILNISKQERIKNGHQAEDFILSASFAGRHISPKTFSVTSSHLYGNCFTLDTGGMIARGGGYDYSLYVVFNLEKFNYLEEISSSYGVRLVLHEKGTYPLPAVEGITLSTNYETHIGLRVIRLNHLGGNYGNCTDGRYFEKKYNTKYTVSLCYSACETENIVSECQCRPLSSPDFMNISNRICDYDDDKECFGTVKDKLFNGKINCKCDSKCEEVMYTRTLSGRRWPHTKYLSKVLVTEICKRNITNTKLEFICLNSSRETQVEYFNDNFLAVYIYFEDLIFAEITDEPLYNTVRFLSDIGGVLGLYIGASALTCVEILQLFLEVILFYRRHRLMMSRRVIDTEMTNEA